MLLSWDKWGLRGGALPADGYNAERALAGDGDFDEYFTSHCEQSHTLRRAVLSAPKQVRTENREKVRPSRPRSRERRPTWRM